LVMGFCAKSAHEPLPVGETGGGNRKEAPNTDCPRVRTRDPVTRSRVTGIRGDAAMRVWMPCGREGRGPLGIEGQRERGGAHLIIFREGASPNGRDAGGSVSGANSTRAGLTGRVFISFVVRKTASAKKSRCGAEPLPAHRSSATRRSRLQRPQWSHRRHRYETSWDRYAL